LKDYIVNYKYNTYYNYNNYIIYKYKQYPNILKLSIPISIKK